MLYVYTSVTVKGSGPPGKEFTYEDHYLFVGRAAGVRSFPSQAASNLRSPRRSESQCRRLRPPGTRIFESRQQRGSAARSTIAVSAYGRVFEREPAGRGRRVLLSAPEGIRTSPDGRPEGSLSKRPRIVASSTCVLRFVTLPNRLRERHDRDPRSSQAAFRRASLRSELDSRRRLYRTSRLFPSEDGSAG